MLECQWRLLNSPVQRRNACPPPRRWLKCSGQGDIISRTKPPCGWSSTGGTRQKYPSWIREYSIELICVRLVPMIALCIASIYKPLEIPTFAYSWWIHHFLIIGLKRSYVHFRFKIHKKPWTGRKIMGQCKQVPVSITISRAMLKKTIKIPG
jgi:hypothetical protein